DGQYDEEVVNMSQPRCRPGDLAIVVESYNPENLGRIVKVILKIHGSITMSK
ncbi:MAG: hypothetical protein RL655_92, partial [Pseudomonadota bacterium]